MNKLKMDIQAVHVVFKSHLDVGFTNYARKVVHDYLFRYIPGAIHVARELRESGRSERLIWTTGSWLIYHYLEKESKTNKDLLVQAIIDGDITWHGLPFTTHSELMDENLFRHGLGLSKILDQRFGKTTIAGKMTDVPGHTRSIVPLLAEAGIQFLHIGINPASTPPGVPPVFVWRDPSGRELVVMYHKGAYGDLMTVPAMPEAVFFAHAGDNHGPQSIHDVTATYDALRRQFPSAKISASTLDAFAQKLLVIKDKLPVVNKEIGDTWIHGIGSDPGKVRRFRELLRLRNVWLAKGRAEEFREEFKSFSDALLLIPEHTWGMDIKTHLADFAHYSNEQFRRVMKLEKFKKIEASWAEQRGYLTQAVSALRHTPMMSEVNKAFKTLTPVCHRSREFERVRQADTLFETDRFVVRFHPITGEMVYLKLRDHGQVWAASRRRLGLFWYENFCQADYDRFVAQYLRHLEKHRGWAIPDFTKPGIGRVVRSHRRWQSQSCLLWTRKTTTGLDFLLELRMPAHCVQHLGCPGKVLLEIRLCDERTSIAYKLQTFEKNACRLPEAMWLSFCPCTSARGAWTLNKMNRQISPLEVIRNGNRKLHAISDYAVYTDRENTFRMETLDAPLVAPGQPSLLDFNNRQPNLQKGIHFNLYNNVWGTNFPMWYSDDTLFRFEITFV
ncbi:MAG: DUF5054 domain-containing protein [Phycisphaerae bacterium]